MSEDDVSMRLAFDDVFKVNFKSLVFVKYRSILF